MDGRIKSGHDVVGEAPTPPGSFRRSGMTEEVSLASRSSTYLCKPLSKDPPCPSPRHGRTRPGLDPGRIEGRASVPRWRREAKSSITSGGASADVGSGDRYRPLFAGRGRRQAARGGRDRRGVRGVRVLLHHRARRPGRAHRPHPAGGGRFLRPAGLREAPDPEAGEPGRARLLPLCRPLARLHAGGRDAARPAGGLRDGPARRAGRSLLQGRGGGVFLRREPLPRPAGRLSRDGGRPISAPCPGSATA